MSTSQNCSCCRQASVQEQSASVKPAATAETDLASDAERASSRLFSRRATLVTGALASTAALASCAEGGGTTVTAPDGTVDMAAASSVGVGKATKLTRGTTTVIVAQPSEGQYKAYSPVCTHQGCQLQVQDSNRIVCPCHGSEFATADGSVLHGPAETPLKTYSVQVKDGRIFVGNNS